MPPVGTLSGSNGYTQNAAGPARVEGEGWPQECGQSSGSLAVKEMAQDKDKVLCGFPGWRDLGGNHGGRKKEEIMQKAGKECFLQSQMADFLFALEVFLLS